MDIEKIRKLSKKASEAGELVKAVTAYKNYLKDKEHMHDITMSEQFQNSERTTHRATEKN